MLELQLGEQETSPGGSLTRSSIRNNDSNRTKAPGQLPSVLSLESQMQPQEAYLREVRDTPAQMRISGHQESGPGETTPQRTKATTIRISIQSHLVNSDGFLS